ncbi:MAG TPA: SGNH/GDSL hydrolase family protein, partial [Acidimicrobiia bacterium]|nr:SGNH/GDSL hydrolase family protein [Acidimicrobiia bacterium]
MHLTGRTARRLLGCVALTTPLLVLPVSSASGAPSPTSYVALGDSYAAGPLIPNQETTPLGCLRSDHDYGSLVAAAIGVSSFQDATCSGATTDAMTSPQNVTPGPNPPQFDRLGPLTQLVTLEIGGNDIGFTDVVASCFSPTPNGTPCQDRWVVGGDDQVSDRIVATAPKVAAVIQGIHARSPDAVIDVVDYLAIFPETGGGCYPQVPVTAGDVPYLRAKEQQLNAMLAQEAAANGATFIDDYALSVGHDACQAPCVRWVEPLAPSSPA